MSSAISFSAKGPIEFCSFYVCLMVFDWLSVVNFRYLPRMRSPLKSWKDVRSLDHLISLLGK